jgi:DNA mismatch endonuclease (patch repair protein)
MRATRRRDTPGEIRLRSELHARGLRFRLDVPIVPNSRRRVDIVLASVRVAVFVDGCFWHGCPEHGTWPKAHGAWWAEKIQANQERDLDTNVRLRRAGWAVVRVWEHKDPSLAADRIASLVRSRKKLLNRKRPRP